MTDRDKTSNTPAKDDTQVNRHGDIIGVTDADPDIEIPRATDDRSGNPKGIEVGRRATGTGDLKQKSGATGIDMGAGGEGTDIEPDR